MSIKMSVKVQDQLQASINLLRERAEVLVEKVEAFNTALDTERAEVNEAVVEYNKALEDAKSLIEELHSDMESEYDDKSERWQESENGELAREWIDELENIDLDTLSEYESNPLLEPDTGHADALEALPTGPQ